MNNRPKDPKTARNKNFLIIGGSGSGKTRFWLKPNLMQCDSETYPCSFVVTDPKGSIVVECGKMLRRKGYRIKIMNTINFKKSHHYNPFSYIHSEKDILKLVNCLIVNTKGEGGKSGDDFWLKAEMLLYTALIGYIHYEAPEEEQNFSTLLEMINAMEVREDDEEFKNAVDLMFDELKERDPGHFAVRQYAKYKLAAGVVCSKRLLNQAVGKSLRTHNLKPKKGAQVMRKNEKITALYERLSRDDFGKDDDQQRESNSISNQELLCRGWFLPPNTYDCGSFVVNGTAVVGKEAKSLITAANQHKKELIYMKSIFEQMGGTYRQEGDYLIPKPCTARGTGIPDWQVWAYAPQLSERTSSCSLRKPAHKRNAASAPRRDRPSLQRAHGNHRFRYGKAGRCDRSAQSRRPDGIGAPHSGDAAGGLPVRPHPCLRRLREHPRLHPPGVPRQAGRPAGHRPAGGLMDIATANNTVAIVMAGPIAKEVEEEYGISPKRSASRLDTFSCIFQGIIPYGAQMLVAISTCATLGYAISAFDIIPLLFYPFLLCLSSLLFILFDKK